MHTATRAHSSSGQLRGAETSETPHTHPHTHDWNHGRILVETFSTFLPGCCGEFRARLRTDAVYLHVGAQGYGLVHGHDAEQRAGGGSEDHGDAAAGDRAAAEGDHNEPKGDNQGTNVQAEPLREPKPPRGGTRRETAGVEEHDGGCIPGHHGHSGPAGTDFTDAETETGESRGRRGEESSTDQIKS